MISVKFLGMYSEKPFKQNQILTSVIFMRENVIAELLDSFKVVTDYAHPAQAIADFIPEPPTGKTYIIGAGKATAAMAAAFEKHYPRPVEGVIVTRYGHKLPTQQIEVLEAAHPVPDIGGIKAVAAMIKLLEKTTENDLIICLLSGGGSALLTAPIEGVSFEDMQGLTDQLLKCGADITEINTVRRHLNIALGGGLAKAAGNTPMVTLAISDVAGDLPSAIASGPTVGDPTSLQDALNILEKYDISAPQSITNALQDPAHETPQPEDPIFENKEYRLIATPKEALEKAKTYWESHQFSTEIFGSEMTGDTNQSAKEHVSKIRAERTQYKTPYALLSGGETTVKVTGQGRGGPNTQFMLQAAIALDGEKGVYGMACDTDGIDGSVDNAGAYITPYTLEKAEKLGLDPEDYLMRNDSYSFFEKIGQLVITGPTHTNVNDYRVFVILQ